MSSYRTSSWKIKQYTIKAVAKTLICITLHKRPYGQRTESYLNEANTCKAGLLITRASIEDGTVKQPISLA